MVFLFLFQPADGFADEFGKLADDGGHGDDGGEKIEHADDEGGEIQLEQFQYGIHGCHVLLSIPLGSGRAGHRRCRWGSIHGLSGIG